MEEVWVVATVYRGCVDMVQVFRDEADARKECRRQRREYGITKGHEAESDNVVELLQVPLR